MEKRSRVEAGSAREAERLSQSIEVGNAIAYRRVGAGPCGAPTYRGIA